MSTLDRRTVLTAAAFAALCGAISGISGGPAFAASPKPQVFSDFRSKLALDGHDPVAYFEAGKPVKGDRAHSLVWNGATWHFASAEAKARFEAEPAKYAPQYGGYCAWAVSEGYTAKGDPAHWAIVDGKLYLNYNAAVQRNWARAQASHIKKADANWPTVLKR